MMMSNYYSSIISTILLCVLLLSASTTTTVNGDNTCSTSNGGDEAQDTIYLKVCEDPELLTLCQLLTSTGLEGDLSQSTTGEEFTLFAPINSAFTGAPPHLIGFDTKQLKKTLKYHVTSGNKDTTSGDDTAADDNNNNRKLSCLLPTSTVLGDLTSQTQCSVEDDGTTQTRIGQLGKVIVKGTPLFVDGSDSDDTPCNGRIIKVTNILGSGLTFFPPQKNGKNGKNGKSSKDGKSRKGGVRGGGGGAWRNYGNNNNSVQQDELLFTYFGVRASNNNNYNNNNYNTKKGPKSFKAGKDFKAGKSFKNHYGGFYGKAAKKGKRE